MKPLFGALNATVAKTILQNAPKRFGRVVEPWGDGGTIALTPGLRRPKEHIVNILDEALFGAMSFAQTGKRSQVKDFDWIASQETFDAVSAITAIEGPEAFYKFLYVKKFGMSMAPDQPPTFDVLATGKDISQLLFALPMMAVGLKRVTLTNDEPLSALGSGGGDTFWILLPKSPEDAQAAESRIASLGGSVFYAAKVADSMEVIDAAKRHADKQVSGISAASIMMSKMVVIRNYEGGRLAPIDPDAADGGMAGMEGAAAMARLRLFAQDAAARVLRREVAAMGKLARRLDLPAGEWEAGVREFYGAHAASVARDLRLSAEAVSQYVAEQQAALLGRGPAAMADWGGRRVDELTDLALGGA